MDTGEGMNPKQIGVCILSAGLFGPVCVSGSSSAAPFPWERSESSGCAMFWRFGALEYERTAMLFAAQLFACVIWATCGYATAAPESDNSAALALRSRAHPATSGGLWMLRLKCEWPSLTILATSIRNEAGPKRRR